LESFYIIHYWGQMILKKSWIGYVSVFILILFVSACGSVESKSETPGATSTASSEDNKPKTHKFKHFYGETEIPVNPQKVVTLQYASQMLSVGVKPIGTVSYLLEGVGPEFQGIEDVGSGDTLNFEKILSLQPDLIIAGDTEQAVYDKLSKIAPTVVIPWMDYDVFGHVKVMGEILNRQKEAEAWKVEFDKKIQAAKEQIIGKIGEGKTVAIYRIDPKEFYVYGVRNVGFTFYRALDLPRPAAVQKEIDKDPNFWAAPISLELLPNYSADYVFVTLLKGEDTKQRYQEIQASSIWKNLPAVKNNHVLEIDMDTWLGYTPHDIDTQLQEAVKLLTEAQ